ncbi:MAG TPA: hypothetical protein G4N97_07290 [Thermoflexia bacterium]|nr:hypothetical protein [Thermoflexia bacterium]
MGRYVIVGNGVAGVAAAQTIVRADPAGRGAYLQRRVLPLLPPSATVEVHRRRDRAGSALSAIEQAQVAAANMVVPGSATYTGTLPATTLRVAGAELTSLGEGAMEEDGYTSLRHVNLAAGNYRKLVLHQRRIVGAILLNDGERVRPITQLIARGVDVSAYADRLLDDDFDLEALLRTARNVKRQA